MPAYLILNKIKMHICAYLLFWPLFLQKFQLDPLFYITFIYNIFLYIFILYLYIYFSFHSFDLTVKSVIFENNFALSYLLHKYLCSHLCICMEIILAFTRTCYAFWTHCTDWWCFQDPINKSSYYREGFWKRVNTQKHSSVVCCKVYP